MFATSSILVLMAIIIVASSFPSSSPSSFYSSSFLVHAQTSQSSSFFYRFAVGGANTTYRDALLSSRCFRNANGSITSCSNYQAVCDDGFTTESAVVLARAPWGLNVTSGKVGWRAARDYRTRLIGSSLVNVRCNKGILNSFTNSCSYSTWGNVYCSAWESVLLLLQLPEINYSFKRTSDYLLLAKNDSASDWGTVCDDSPFDYSTAYAICRLLGKTNLTKVIFFGGGNYDIINRTGVKNFALDSVSCPQNTVNFSKSCTHDLYGKHDCSLTYESVSLFCNSSDRVPLRFTMSTGYVYASPGINQQSSSPTSSLLSAEGMSESTLNKICFWASGFGDALLQNHNNNINKLKCTLLATSTRAAIWNFTCPENATKSEECDFTYDSNEKRVYYPAPIVRVVRVRLPDMFSVILDSRTNAFLVTLKSELLPSPSAPRVASTVCSWYLSRVTREKFCQFAGFSDMAEIRKKSISWYSYAPLQVRDLVKSNNISGLGGQLYNADCPTSATSLSPDCTYSHENYQRCGTASGYLQGTCDGTGLSPYVDDHDHNHLKIRDRHNYQHIYVLSYTEAGYSGVLSPTTAAALCRMMGHKNVTNASVTVATRNIYRRYSYSPPRGIIKGLKCNENSTHIRDCDYQYATLDTIGYNPFVTLLCTSPQDEWKFSYAPNTKIVIAESPAGISQVESGPICAYSMNLGAARFICRQLAKDKSNNITYDPSRVVIRMSSSSELKLSNKSIALSSFTCRTNATNMSECTFREQNGCSYGNAAAVLCDATSFVYTFTRDPKSNVVLASAPNASDSPPRTVGRICADNTNSIPGIARVVCKSLGYTDLRHALGWQRGYCNYVTCPDAYSRQVRIDGFTCPPDAEDQSDCEIVDSYHRFSTGTCSSYYNLAVTCTADGPEKNYFRFAKVRNYNDIRLLPPSASSGFWDFAGDFSSAYDLRATLSVICKFAGFRVTSSFPYKTTYCTSSGNAYYIRLIDNISCNMSANTLSDCDWRAAKPSRCYSRVFCGSSTMLDSWQFKLRPSDNAVLARAPGTMSFWSEFEAASSYYRQHTVLMLCRALGFDVVSNYSTMFQTSYLGVCNCYAVSTSIRTRFSEKYQYTYFNWNCARSQVDTVLQLWCTNRSAATTTQQIPYTTYVTTLPTTTTVGPPTTSTTAGSSTASPPTSSTTTTGPTTTSLLESGMSNVVSTTSLSTESSVTATSSNSSDSPSPATTTTNSTDDPNSSMILILPPPDNNGAAVGSTSSPATFENTGIPIIIILVIILAVLVVWLVMKKKQGDKEKKQEEDAISLQMLSDQANASQSACLISQSSTIATHTGFVFDSQQEDQTAAAAGATGSGGMIASQPTRQGAGGFSGQRRRAANAAVESIVSGKTEQEAMEEELLAAVAPCQSFSLSTFATTEGAAATSAVVNVPSTKKQQQEQEEDQKNSSSCSAPSAEEGNDASEILKAVARALGSPGSATSSSSSTSLTAASLATAAAASASQKPEEEKDHHLPERTKQVHQPLAALGSSGPSAAAAASKKWKSKSKQTKERQEKEKRDVIDVLELADL